MGDDIRGNAMLRVIAAALLIGLLFKDLAFVGDRYVIRTVVEVTALLAGLFWLLTRASSDALKHQALLFIYLFVLLLTAFVSSTPSDVILQVIALGAIILFSVGYFATVPSVPAVNALLVPTFWVYALVAAGCLVYGKYFPGNAFVYEWGDPVPRFRGLFGEPAQMGMIAGLTFGFAIFVRTWWIVRIPALMAGALCVFYTFSRTFWVAALAALVGTLWMYKPRLRIPLAFAAIVIGLFGAIFMDKIVQEESRLLRADSLSHMSGRTEIWSVAIDAFQERPLLGYGFSVGADAIMGTAVIRNMGKSGYANTPTLHNGFVQAILDSGALGLVLYC